MVYLLYKTSSLKDENPHKLVKDCYPPRHFRRWGGLYAHTRKKKRIVIPTAFAPLGGGLGARTRKKKGISLSKIGVRKIRSIITNKGTWVLYSWETLKENIIKIWVWKIYAINFWKVVKPLGKLWFEYTLQFFICR